MPRPYGFWGGAATRGAAAFSLGRQREW